MIRVKSLTRPELKRHPLPAVRGGDKDSHGQILIIAGSPEVPGAALLAAHAAMRSGAGKLQLAVPQDIAIPVGVAMPEAMVVGFPTARDGGPSRGAIRQLIDLAEAADAVVAGPGIRQNDMTAALAAKLCSSDQRSLVLDAALLRALPRGATDTKSSRPCPILLPHSGEMADLLDCSPHEVDADPLAAGRSCARLYRAHVLVKGVESHVVLPDGRAWRYGGGSAGLGVSGSGDVLAGIVGGLLARGAEPLTALLWGVWLHGEAGRKLSAEVGPIGFLAREIAGQIPGLLASA